VPNLKPNYKFTTLLVFGVGVFLCPEIGAQPATTWTFEWGTHLGEDPGGGSNMPDAPLGADTSPLTSVMQYLYDIGGTKLATSGTGNSYTGDLIELGFFDTDGTIDGGSYTPNEDHTDLFKGVWTPLTSKTKIGRDWAATTVNAGEFYFTTKFILYTDSTDSRNNYSLTNQDDGNPLDFDYLGDNSNDPNNYENRLNAITSDTLIGIRFYDNTAASSGVARYNTIMDSAWDFGASGNSLSLHATDGSATRSTLAFEFDNTSADAASKVGTSDTTINGLSEGDFVATVTYFDGDESINVGDGGIGSSVFSGFDGTGRIYGGNDANVVTLHSASGNTGADAYEFDGDFYNASTGTSSTDITIVKSGTGDQILSGNLNLADSDNTSASGGLNIASGNLILKPASGKTQVVEYLTGAGGLKLDNSGVNDGTIVSLGFANQTSSTFSGTVVLDGTGGTSKISVSSGTSDSDYDNEQTISGVISESGGTKKLVKDGVGRLVLSGNNSFTGGLDIDGGTVQLGHANGAGTGAGVITINTGKLEVATGVTVTETINGSATGKSMIGGDGTISSVTVGSGASEIDVISPGEGHSSSTSSAGSTQQVGRNTSLADAIGSLTITNLDLNGGGVFDWEIGDFSGSTAGSDWDLLNVGTLNWDPSNSLTINILPLASDGSAGETAGGMWANKTGTSGFKFLDVGAWGTGTEPSVGTVTSGFNINSSAWLYHKNDPYGDWSVYYDGSAFYLQYSAVPEPSTYMMVTGLLMVPGMSYLRRIRRKKNSVEEESSL
jgi:autotransporter-associated beta strand protein